MTIERRLENSFITYLKTLENLSDTQIIGSRDVAVTGKTKSEDNDKSTIIAVACGFRQNDTFSLSLITMPVSVSIMTRAELDPTSLKHDTVIETIANVLSRWHKYGTTMSDIFSNEKFLAGELRMDGGSNRVYDSTTNTWSETINFSIRGAEKFSD